MSTIAFCGHFPISSPKYLEWHVKTISLGLNLWQVTGEVLVMIILIDPQTRLGRSTATVADHHKPLGGVYTYSFLLEVIIYYLFVYMVGKRMCFNSSQSWFNICVDHWKTVALWGILNFLKGSWVDSSTWALRFSKIHELYWLDLQQI